MSKIGFLVCIMVLTPIVAMASDAGPTEVNLCSSAAGVDSSAIQKFIPAACDSGLAMRAAIVKQLQAAAQQQGNQGNVGAAGGLGSWLGGGNQSTAAAPAVANPSNNNIGGAVAAAGTVAAPTQPDQSAAANLYK